jgi:hypothetical protein
MTTLASCAALAESISCSVREMADGLSSLSSVISKALLHESTFIWRRFEASLLRQISSCPANYSILQYADRLFWIRIAFDKKADSSFLAIAATRPAAREPLDRAVGIVVLTAPSLRGVLQNFDSSSQSTCAARPKSRT